MSFFPHSILEVVKMSNSILLIYRSDFFFAILVDIMRCWSMFNMLILCHCILLSPSSTIIRNNNANMFVSSVFICCILEKNYTYVTLDLL